MMIFKYLTVLSLITVLTFGCMLFGPTEEEISFYERAKNGTSQDCDTYLMTFSDGEFAPEIKNLREEKLEDEIYQKAAVGNIADCQEYVTKYPAGKYLAEVANLFYNHAKAGSSQDCDKFLTAFPTNENVEEITKLRDEKLAEEEAYNKAVNGTTKECAEYISAYPDGKFYKEVYEHFYQLAINGKSADCAIFASTLPQDEKTPEILEAQAQKEELESKEKALEGSLDDLTQYLEKYSDKDVSLDEVRERLFSLIRVVKKIKVETADGTEKFEDKVEYNSNAEAQFLKYFPEDYRSFVILQNKDKHLTKESIINIPDWYNNPPFIVGEMLCGLGSLSYDSPEQLNLIKTKAEEKARKDIIEKSFKLIFKTFTRFLKDSCNMTDKELKVLNIEKKISKEILEGIEIVKSESIEQINYSILYCLAQVEFENVFDVVSISADLIFYEAGEISTGFPDFIDTEAALVKMKKLMKIVQEEENKLAEIFVPTSKFLELLETNQETTKVKAFGSAENKDKALMQAFYVTSATLIEENTIDIEDIEADEEWDKIIFINCKTIPAESEYRLRGKIWEWEGTVLCNKAKILEWAQSKNYLIGPKPEVLAQFNVAVIPQYFMNKTDDLYFQNNFDRVCSNRMIKILKENSINVVDYEDETEKLTDSTVEPAIGLNVDFFLIYELEVDEPDYTSIDIKLTLKIISAGNNKLLITIVKDFSHQSNDIIKAETMINNFVESVTKEFLTTLNYHWLREHRKGFLYRMIFSNVDETKKAQINTTLQGFISPYYKKMISYSEAEDVFDISFYSMLKFDDSTMFYEVLVEELAKNDINISERALTARHAIKVSVE